MTDRESSAPGVKLVVTDLTPTGSTHVEIHEMSFNAAPKKDEIRRSKISRARLWSHRADLDLGWHISRFEPGAEVDIHSTDTVDLVCVITGRLRLTLPDSYVEVGPGDCILQRRGSHGWKVIGEGDAVVNVVWFPSTDFFPVT